MSISQFNFYPTLTPARVVSTTNLVGIYNNGANNNGLGATISAATPATLVIDGITLNLSDRILLIAQSSNFQSGLYIVTNASSNWVIERTADFQCVEQMKPGMSISISTGSNAGATYILCEPLPKYIGIDSIIFESGSNQLGLGTAAFKAASDNTKTTVASVSGSITSGHVAAYADTSGSILDGGVLGQAAHKAVSNNSQGTVASTNGSFTTGDILIAADISGTVSSAGPYGTAAGKAASSFIQPNVASVSGTPAVNQLVKFSDTSGTITTIGTNMIVGSVSTAGGSASLTLSTPGATPGCLMFLILATPTAISLIQTYTPGTNNVAVVLDIAPGPSTFNYIIFTNATS